VADTVPTPAPGQGVYYVTAATYQDATRYARKTTPGTRAGATRRCCRCVARKVGKRAPAYTRSCES